MSLQNPKYSVQWLCLHTYNSYCNNFGEKKLREPGVEPGSIAWKATMLPLYHSRIRNLKLFM